MEAHAQPKDDQEKGSSLSALLEALVVDLARLAAERDYTASRKKDERIAPRRGKKDTR